MQITLVEFLQGFFSLIFVSVVVYLAIHFFMKYFKYKEKNLLFVGIAWILLSIIWLPDAINLILILAFDTYTSLFFYYILVLGLLPFALGFWMIVITDLLYKEKQKVILLIIFILYCILEIVFIILLFTNIDYIGYYTSPFDVQSSLFSQFYLLISLFIFEITGFLLARDSLKADSTEIKLKGKFLLFAFISFAIGGVIEVVAPVVEVTVVISRSITILSVICFYIGFTLPDFIKKLVLRQE